MFPEYYIIQQFKSRITRILLSANGNYKKTLSSFPDGFETVKLCFEDTKKRERFARSSPLSEMHWSLLSLLYKRYLCKTGSKVPDREKEKERERVVVRLIKQTKATGIVYKMLLQFKYFIDELY